MLYDTSKSIDKQRAIQRFEHLINSSKVLELKEKKINVLSDDERTPDQNRYFHLLVKWYALEYGDRERMVKQDLIKTIICPDIFKTTYENHKTGEVKDDLRSTADLTVEEMSNVITRFRNYASEVAGIYLPEAKDVAYLREIAIEIEKNKQYL